MKTKILLPFFAAIAAMAASSYLATRSNKAEAESNLLLLQNVEALADGSEGNGFEYPTGAPYTTKCNVAIGKSLFGTTRCSATVITCQGGGSGCNSKKCPQHPA